VKGFQLAVQNARAELVYRLQKVRQPLIEEVDRELSALIDFGAFSRIFSLNDLPRYGHRVVALDRACDCLGGGQSWTLSADPVVEAEEVEQKATAWTSSLLAKSNRRRIEALC
jgi:hypothetical protein